MQHSLVGVGTAKTVPKWPSGFTTLLVCGVCFLIGWRLNPPASPPVLQRHQDVADVHQPNTQANEAQLHHAQSQRQQRHLVEAVQRQAVSTAPLHAPAPPLFGGAEEAIMNAGLLNDYAALHPGDTGYPGWITQPQQLLSNYPRAYHWPRFISKSQAEKLIVLASTRLRPSELVLKEGDNADDYKGVRTSEGAFFSPSEDPMLQMVAEKISLLTGIPMSHGEPFNVLRYELGQHYDQHYDYLPEELYGEVKNNRMATVLVYLEAPEEGGETIFPLEGADGLSRLDRGEVDYKHCDVGYKYKPQSGDALLFYSMYPNGTFDRHSLHGGCPVLKGRKFVMTRWLRIDTLTAEGP